jgi:uncharacterized protein (DUF736 family)
MSKQVGALWPVTGSQNEDFVYSGVIETLSGDIKIGVFKNSKKEEGDKQPEFHIVRMEEHSK